MNTEWFSKPRLICGSMSGTSLDGVNSSLAYYYIDSEGKSKFDLLDANYEPFPDDLRTMLFNIINQPLPIANLSFAEYYLSRFYYECISSLCSKNKIARKKLDGVAIHGQTVWHEPRPESRGEKKIASTLQIGSIPALSALLGALVIGDFRAADIALDGEGAPLVPIFDYNFLSSSDEDRITLNVGGIANFTYMPKNSSDEEVAAFDAGPGNVLIDIAVKRFFDRKFDDNGDIARSGNNLPRLFDALKQIPFITQKPPKSTGRELFNPPMLDSYLITTESHNSAPEDIVRTLTDFTAWAIAENVRLFANEKAKIIISGGGAFNSLLIEKLNEELPNTAVHKISEYGIPIEAKEAICFGYLGYRSLGGLYGNLPNVTGASKKAVLGSIAKCV